MLARRVTRSRWARVCFLAAFLAAFAGSSYGQQARIAISDLKPFYCKGESLEVTIWNRGEQAISINVAIETLVDGRWVETWASLRTPPDQIPTKIAATDLVEPGKSVAYSFDIFRFPVRADLAKAKWRLRADTIAETQRTSLASAEFAICPD
jgi:hypothetical protein